MSTPVIRQATADDLVAYFGAAPRQSMRAYVAVVDGRPVGIAGVSYEFRGRDARVKLFSEMKPEMRRHKKAIVRGARAMLEAFGAPGMVAVANPEEKGACRFLAALGFRPGHDTPNGRLFVYEGPR